MRQAAQPLPENRIVPKPSTWAALAFVLLDVALVVAVAATGAAAVVLSMRP